VSIPFRTFAATAGSVLAITACSTADDLGPAADPPFCIDLKGVGQTEGTIHRLRGNGEFTFGDQLRPAFVALYIFEMKDAENGGKRAHLNYQFIWDGESFLTADDVFLEHILEEDTFRFNVNMTIIAASGRFTELIGKEPVTLDATLRLGPPSEPGNPPAAHEQFTINGRLCGDAWRP
jgi:hypothetical protein